MIVPEHSRRDYKANSCVGENLAIKAVLFERLKSGECNGTTVVCLKPF